MGCFKMFALILMVGATLFAAIATFTKVGAQDIEHPEGINLRDESVRGSRTGFFGYYATTRSHRGGGLRGGK